MADTGFVVDARQFGAVGDGVAGDTLAIQAAIDSCSDAGGGQVVVPAGRYRSGTLYLKSNVELHLTAGATIVASANRDDYNSDDHSPHDLPLPAERVSAAHLVIAYRQTNVSITGPGAIDGNGDAFLTPRDRGGAPTTYRSVVANRGVVDWRPAQMVFFFECRRARLADVRLVNAPYWTVYLYCCRDVQVRDLIIENPPDTPNGDGIDIVSCQNVTVSGCTIRTGDDCLVVRTRNRQLEDDPPCQDIVVSNCVLSSPTSGIRIGVDDGTVRRCLFSGIVVTDSRTGITMVARYNHNVHHGTAIENVHFSDFVIDACVPFSIAAGDGATPPAAIQDVSLSRFRVIAAAGAQLVGSPDVPLQRISLTDFSVTVRGGTENAEFAVALPSPVARPAYGGYPGTNGTPALPCLLYAEHVADLTVDGIRIHWSDASDVWHDGIHLDHIDGAHLRNAVLRNPRPAVAKADVAAVRCRDSRNVTVSGCQALPGTGTFLDTGDSPVVVIANDLGHAETPVRGDGFQDSPSPPPRSTTRTGASS